MNLLSDRFISMQPIHDRKDQQGRGGMIPTQLSGSQQKRPSKQNRDT